MFSAAQLAAPLVGSLDVAMFPEPSTATQSESDAHATPRNILRPSMRVGAHAALPPVGFAVVSASPPASSATQNDDDGHARSTIPSRSLPVRPFAAAMAAPVHVPAPPVGFVDQNAWSVVSTPTQSVALGQET